MAVSQGDIKAAIISLNNSSDTGEGIDGDAWADGMATIIRNAILTGDVQFPIAVTVGGGGTGGTTEIGSIL